MCGQSVLVSTLSGQVHESWERHHNERANIWQGHPSMTNNWTHQRSVSSAQLLVRRQWRRGRASCAITGALGETRLSELSWWSLQSSGTWSHVDYQFVIDVSEARAAFVFNRRLIRCYQTSNFRSPPRPRRPYRNLHNLRHAAARRSLCRQPRHSLMLNSVVMGGHLQRISMKSGKRAESTNASSFMPVSKIWPSLLDFQKSSVTSYTEDFRETKIP
jgi:hypothetical protein